MEARREAKERLSLMQHDIRKMALQEEYSSRKMLPSLRELADKYDLSHSMVARGLKDLVQQGIVHSAPRVGMFVGRSQPSHDGTYLLISQHTGPMTNCPAVRIGFEERITQLGGSCLVLSRPYARAWYEAGRLPALAGIFEFDEVDLTPESWQAQEIVAPRVHFRRTDSDAAGTDIVDFDHVNGGRQAVQHLLDLGHQQIAFLGLHGSQDNPGVFTWSQDREAGWRTGLKNAGHATDRLSFCPVKTSAIAAEVQQSLAYELALKLLREAKVTAVVTVNEFAAQGLMQALRTTKVPKDKWPSIVSFDNTNYEEHYEAAAMTTLRLPWEEIGRAAADLLWEKSHSQSATAVKQRLVPMRLIVRLSCRTNWAQYSIGMENQTSALPQSVLARS